MSQEAFRGWLIRRYGDLDALNEAWGTAFWGQTYYAIEHVRTPAASASVVNPAQQLDFRRFCDQQLLDCYRAERDVIREHAAVPITTNFMATACPSVDLWKWAREVDVVSNDHYLTAEREDSHVMLSLDADLTRSLAGGRPWLLMEHSTSAVNWQGRNIAKATGELARNSLSHFARGADGIMFFQWRASRQGAEKFHSAMLPASGPDSRIFREVRELGSNLPLLDEIRGSQVCAEVAVLWDWESFWAQDLEWRPSVDLDHRERTEAFYRWLWDHGITADFVHPGGDLSGYRVVLAPQMYLLTRQSVKNLTDFVAGGGNLLTSYFTGVVDERDALHAEGLSGPLSHLTGVHVEEFLPLRHGQQLQVSWPGGDAPVNADVWAEACRVADDVEVLARFDTGPAAGGVAVTRRPVESGNAWYVGSRLDAEGLDTLIGRVCEVAGVSTRERHGVEVVERRRGNQRWTFVINHTDRTVTEDVAGLELLTEERCTTLTVPPGEVRVVRRSA